MNEDNELLHQFAEHRAQEAFTALVERNIRLVYSAALRQVGGDAHLAADVTQSVFVSVACRAERLARHPALKAWLFTATRFIAAKALRRQQRWLRREEAANATSAEITGATPRWEDLRGVIDEALHDLAESDRRVILLRYFDERSLAEVGSAVGVGENAARMRVDRALEKLRRQLARRGITSTAAAIGIALAEQPVLAVPAGLVGTVVNTSLVGATVASTGGLAIFGFMSSAKLITGAVCLTLLAGVGGYALHTPTATSAPRPTVTSNSDETMAEITRLRAENAQLHQDNDALAAARSRGFGNQASAGSGTAALSAIDRLRVLADAQKSGLLSARVQITTPQGKLTPHFIELFALTPPEAETMQQALDKARARLSDLAVANATARTTADGKLVIDVKPFDGGGAVYDETMDAVSGILGPDRSAAFLGLVGSQLGDALDQFGAEQRTVTLSRDVGKDGEPNYSVVDQRRSVSVPPNLAKSGTPPGQPNMNRNFSTGRTMSSGPTARDDMKNRLGGLAKLVPPEF